MVHELMNRLDNIPDIANLNVWISPDHITLQTLSVCGADAFEGCCRIALRSLFQSARAKHEDKCRARIPQVDLADIGDASSHLPAGNIECDRVARHGAQALGH